jgi:hypothetical protein
VMQCDCNDVMQCDCNDVMQCDCNDVMRCDCNDARRRWPAAPEAARGQPPGLRFGLASGVAGWRLAERFLRIGRELAPRRRGGYHYFRFAEYE